MPVIFLYDVLLYQARYTYKFHAQRITVRREKKQFFGSPGKKFTRVNSHTA